MASFYAELRVAGHRYPLLRCTYSTFQMTDDRGRPASKTRDSPVELTMLAPRDSFLPAWAADPYKRCAVDIVYSDANGGQAIETLHLAGAICTGFGLHFQEGRLSADGQTVTESSYQAYLTLTDPDGYRWHAGGPGAYVPPAAREHGAPPPPSGPLLAPDPAATAAQELQAKQQRYDARRRLMRTAQTNLARHPNTAAHTALARLQRNNVAVERARLSEHVYYSQQLDQRPEPVGWHMLTPKELARKGITPAMLNNPRSGFKAALYESSFERPPRTVIAYAGTEDGADWETNLHQGVGIETEQYNRAMKLADKVTKNSPRGTVDITGHSLGGGLASAGVAVTGVKGYTFNAAGLHSATVARAPYNVTADEMHARGQRIDAYHSTADPLTNLQSGLAGNMGELAGWPVGPQALGVPRPLVPAEGWQHEWRELVTRNPLTSSGRMALEGHGVDPEMVDNIEVEKAQDTATLTQYNGATP